MIYSDMLHYSKVNNCYDNAVFGDRDTFFDCAAKVEHSYRDGLGEIHDFKRSALKFGAITLNKPENIPTLADHLFSDTYLGNYYEADMKDVRAAFSEIYDSIQTYDEKLLGTRDVKSPTFDRLTSYERVMLSSLRTPVPLPIPHPFVFSGMYRKNGHARALKSLMKEIKRGAINITSDDAVQRVTEQYHDTHTLRMKLAGDSDAVEVPRFISEIEEELGYFYFKDLFCMQFVTDLFRGEAVKEVVKFLQQSISEIHPAILELSNKVAITSINYEGFEETKYEYLTIYELGSLNDVPDTIWQMRYKLPNNDDFYMLLKAVLPLLGGAIIDVFSILIQLSCCAVLDTENEFKIISEDEGKEPTRRRVSSALTKKQGNPEADFLISYYPRLKVMDYNMSGAQKALHSSTPSKGGGEHARGHTKSLHYVKPYFAVYKARTLKDGTFRPQRTVLRKGHWRGSADIDSVNVKRVR